MKKGEVVVVCGPSGSGKSTLIKTVNGLEPIQQGQIIVDGTTVNDKKTNLAKLRSRVGMVFQHFELFPAFIDYREPHPGAGQGAQSRQSRSPGERA
ncbi:glutamate Aspartate transport ATP-binding protein GltL [Klebsiella michiganensis]|uniref:Glutamate Aspartate transport ATP-binding protein GltL n=1 Tax=Klebsiella michiganensis TaxID=1134687 RepID=A0A7H4N4Q0_9ENTR|nr:glutamate Aspartate transport ATP-binding protein GltL [Klebsiella michiganensis]